MRNKRCFSDADRSTDWRDEMQLSRDCSLAKTSLQSRMSYYNLSWDQILYWGDHLVEVCCSLRDQKLQLEVHSELSESSTDSVTDENAADLLRLDEH